MVIKVGQTENTELANPCNPRIEDIQFVTYIDHDKAALWIKKHVDEKEETQKLIDDMIKTVGSDPDAQCARQFRAAQPARAVHRPVR